MNKFAYIRAARTLRRVAFFSLVTAPSLVLFFLFITLSFNHSLAGSFLSTARSLIADAPDGMVNISVCDKPKISHDDLPDERAIPSLSAEDNVLQQSSPMFLATCLTGRKPASEWQKETDSTIRQLYLLSVVMGLFVSWLFSGALIPARSIFRRMKS